MRWYGDVYYYLWALLFFAITASAEEKNPMDLEQIVVTATRTEMEASQAPASTSVITGRISSKGPSWPRTRRSIPCPASLTRGARGLRTFWRAST